MHIKEIELHNFKTIEDFKQEFSGSVYLVTGENEIGKSTLLGAISTLLTGDRSANLLKQGRQKGYAKMVVGEGDQAYTVELRFTEANPRGTLTISQANGMKSDNKSMLQSIFKYNDFDANEFVSWSNTAEGKRKQVEVVKSLLSEEIQKAIIEIDQKLAQYRSERMTVNSQLKTAEVHLNSSMVYEDSVQKYSEPIDIRDLYEQKSQASARNEKIASVRTRYDERQANIKNHSDESNAVLSKIDQEIKEAEDRIKKLKQERKASEETAKARLSELETKQQGAEQWLAENYVVDTDDLELKINKADFHNEKHKEVLEFTKNKKEFDDLVLAKSVYENDIDELLKLRAKTIQEGALPIEGLSFTDEGLFLNGVPFAPGEVSTSQEMEVAAKLIIAKNPTVKVFRVAQGESLGSAKLKAIVEFAQKNGYQGFVEEVKRGQNQLVVEEYTEA